MNNTLNNLGSSKASPAGGAVEGASWGSSEVLLC